MDGEIISKENVLKWLKSRKTIKSFNIIGLALFMYGLKRELSCQGHLKAIAEVSKIRIKILQSMNSEKSYCFGKELDDLGEEVWNICVGLSPLFS